MNQLSVTADIRPVQPEWNFFLQTLNINNLYIYRCGNIVNK